MKRVREAPRGRARLRANPRRTARTSSRGRTPTPRDGYAPLFTPERSPDRSASPRAAPRTACVECVATVGKPETRPFTRAPREADSPLASVLAAVFLFENVAPQAPAAPAPLRKLATTGLIDVYKRINRNYYETRSWRSSRGGSAAGSADGADAAGANFRNRGTGAARGVGSADASARRSETLGGSRRRSHSLSSSAGGRLGSHTSVHTGASWRASGSPADRDAPTARASTAPRHLLHDRYAVGRVIGRGAFARVVVAYDIVTDARVAIKIIRNASRSFHARARKEIEILRVLGGGGGARGARSAGASGEMEGSHPNVVVMLDHFALRRGDDASGLFGPEESTHADDDADETSSAAETQRLSDTSTNANGLRCLVFELLSHSLYDVLRATSFRGVSLALVRKFSFQILHALRYLKSHGVVHLDLKPENVLLCSTDRSRVKLVDFGSSRWVNETALSQTYYAQSRFYRAAEVLLGLPCGCPADAWSLGCIMVEMHGGKPLFPGRDETHQLAKITETLGGVPADMFAAASAERRATHARAAAKPETRGDGEGSDEKDDALGRETTSRTKTNASESFDSLGFVPKPHGSRPLRTVIAAASSAHEARQRERRAGGFGDAAAADAAATSLRALGLEKNGDDSRPADPPPSRASFADAEHAEDAALTSVALFCDVVERLLTYDPELRAQPGTALEHPFFAEMRAARGGFEGLGGDGFADEADVDDEMLMYGLEGTDA